MTKEPYDDSVELIAWYISCVLDIAKLMNEATSADRLGSIAPDNQRGLLRALDRLEEHVMDTRDKLTAVSDAPKVTKGNADHVRLGKQSTVLAKKIIVQNLTSDRILSHQKPVDQHGIEIVCRGCGTLLNDEANRVAAEFLFSPVGDSEIVCPDCGTASDNEFVTSSLVRGPETVVAFGTRADEINATFELLFHLATKPDAIIDYLDKYTDDMRDLNHDDIHSRRVTVARKLASLLLAEDGEDIKTNHFTEILEEHDEW